ncbi:MAG TPA: DUF5995 family protein [Blastocatellia bacterium]|nr:DUF5995 family protein [Blastocatellia bacterium]
MSAQPALAIGPAKTIDEVIAHLDQIIRRAWQDNSRLGYFATLYRNVTVEVKRGIAQGRFEDGARMERLDVTFANRYLTALADYQAGQPTPPCWTAAFHAASHWPPIVLQHLLLGMNAHINFDLGAAAAITCPGDQLPPLKHDFDEINNVLAAMIGGVQFQLSKISPWMKLLDLVGGRSARAVLNWSIDVARDAAWRFAEQLAPLTPAEQQPVLKRRDDDTTALARLVRHPGYLVSTATFAVRLSEVRSTRKIIDILT